MRRHQGLTEMKAPCWIVALAFGCTIVLGRDDASRDTMEVGVEK